MNRPTFLLFGDSLTQRGFEPGAWAATLANQYSRRADVLVRGFSGYNTRWAMHALPHLLPPGLAVPALVTLFFGANDAALPDRDSKRQHVPVGEYAERLHQMAAHFQGLGVRDIVLITPPPVSDEARTKAAREWRDAGNGTCSTAEPQPERTNAAAKAYAAACCAAGQSLRLPVVDLWGGMQEYSSWEATFLSDGLHFTVAGNQLLAELLLEAIEAKLPHLRPEALPLDFPDHKDIDSEDPARAFAQ